MSYHRLSNHERHVYLLNDVFGLTISPLSLCRLGIYTTCVGIVTLGATRVRLAVSTWTDIYNRLNSKGV